ncbi:MAG: DNA polymerase III subunit gamma/tau [Thermacetogeniaceae bacterium]
MGQLSLYREWRPQSFREVVGQEHVCRTLRNAVVQGRLAHAYLFCGPRGTGKTSTARILAKAANCPNCTDGEPCNECDSCRSITAGTALDVLEMDAASHRGIEEIRELKQKVGFAPSSAKYKFYIIDEVHMLTGEAFNALLKTLEEPPRHTIFVLATTEAHKVPATILSRCQRFDFRRLSREQIAGHLKRVASEEGWDVEPEALRLIARLSGGALRDALGLLDQAVSYGGGRVRAADVEALAGIPKREALESLIEAVRQGKTSSALEQLEELFARGYDPRQVLYQLIDCVRDSLLSRGCPDADAEWFAAALRLLAEADSDMRGHIRPDLALELAIVRLADPSPLGRRGAGAAARDAAATPKGVSQRGDVGRASEGPPKASASQEPLKAGTAGSPGGEELPPDPSSIRTFLQGRFRKQPLLGKVLAEAEIGCSGTKVVIKAPPPFDAILMKDENLSSLREALKEFAGELELEVAEASAPKMGPAEPPVTAPARGSTPGEREGRAPKPAAGEQLDPVVGAALSLFKGKIIERKEDE